MQLSAVDYDPEYVQIKTLVKGDVWVSMNFY